MDNINYNNNNNNNNNNKYIMTQRGQPCCANRHFS